MPHTPAFKDKREIRITDSYGVYTSGIRTDQIFLTIGRALKQIPAMKIAMISSEISPFAKTGGLADVVETLSSALGCLDHELCLIMPGYRRSFTATLSLTETSINFSVPIAHRYEKASVLKASIGQRISVYLVCSDKYYDREFLYGTAQADYPDNLERFTFFCRSA